MAVPIQGDIFVHLIIWQRDGLAENRDEQTDTTTYHHWLQIYAMQKHVSLLPLLIDVTTYHHWLQVYAMQKHVSFLTLLLPFI